MTRIVCAAGRRLVRFAGPALLLVASSRPLPAAAPATAAKPPHGATAAGKATVGHRFPGVAKAKSMYDDPARDAWQKPAELVAALALAPGERVADLGAGTGYFLRHLAGAVGSDGTVFAVEVEKELVAEIRKRAEKEKLPQVVPVLGSFDDPRLPRGAIDLLLVVDTYHHVDDRGRYFREVATRLSPKGRLVIVDFEKRPLPVGPGMDHKLDDDQVIAELTAAGWELIRRHDGLLPYQYVLEFRPATR